MKNRIMLMSAIGLLSGAIRAMDRQSQNREIECMLLERTAREEATAKNIIKARGPYSAYVDEQAVSREVLFVHLDHEMERSKERMPADIKSGYELTRDADGAVNEYAHERLFNTRRAGEHALLQIPANDELVLLTRMTKAITPEYIQGYKDNIRRFLEICSKHRCKYIRPMAARMVAMHIMDDESMPLLQKVAALTDVLTVENYASHFALGDPRRPGYGALIGPQRDQLNHTGVFRYIIDSVILGRPGEFLNLQQNPVAHFIKAIEATDASIRGLTTVPEASTEIKRKFAIMQRGRPSDAQ